MFNMNYLNQKYGQYMENISALIQTNLGRTRTLGKTVTNECGAIKDAWDVGRPTNIM